MLSVYLVLLSVKVKDIACNACIIIICCHQVIQVVMLWFCVLVVMTMMSLESLTTYEATKRSFMMRNLLVWTKDSMYYVVVALCSSSVV